MNTSIRLYEDSTSESIESLISNKNQFLLREDLQTVVDLCEYFIRNSPIDLNSKKTVLKLLIKASNSLKQFRGGI